ncbi:hypothetical protein BDR26DRAFT_862350 [Obelidium mucronatum]|nr:hypothetical protein BDR26DRAFT_862350 [Obelidium mucronatum]
MPTKYYYSSDESDDTSEDSCSDSDETSEDSCSDSDDTSEDSCSESEGTSEDSYSDSDEYSEESYGDFNDWDEDSCCDSDDCSCGSDYDSEDPEISELTRQTSKLRLKPNERYLGCKTGTFEIQNNIGSGVDKNTSDSWIKYYRKHTGKSGKLKCAFLRCSNEKVVGGHVEVAHSRSSRTAIAIAPICQPCNKSTAKETSYFRTKANTTLVFMKKQH